MEQTDQILKQDAAGRVWTPVERREALLDEFERSGLPATQFAGHIGVKYSTFAVWVQKRRKSRSAGSAAPELSSAAPPLAGWVEATVESMAGRAPRVLVVHLPGGARLEVADAMQAELAGRLLRALGGGTAC